MALVQTQPGVSDDGQMPPSIPVEQMFKGRHFDQKIVVLCVRWYLSFKLSYRDLVSMMGERGIYDGAHDDSAVGPALHSRIPETVEPICPTHGRLLAHGRNVHFV